MGHYIHNKKIGAFFLLFFLMTFSVHGEEEGLYVEKVLIEGTSRISEMTIRSQLQTKPGTVVSREDVNQDIRTLYQLGYFKDVQVDQEKGKEGWIYTFHVIEKPLLSKIVIEGNKKIKDDALREVITIPLYQPLSENKVRESMDAMKKLYAAKRYYLVDIDYRIRTAPNGDYEFVFVIKEYSQAFVRQVQFIGNTVFTDEELGGLLKTRKKAFLGWLTGAGKYNEEDLKQDVLRLTFYYLKNGYLRVRVESPQVTISKDRRYLFVTFYLEEGDRYRVGTVDIAGDILTTKEELLQDRLTKPGQIYNREFIEKDLLAMTEAYANQGYAFVHIQPATTTNEVEKVANIIFDIQKGSRISIEKINVKGNTTTRDKVVRRELEIKEGDIYNEHLMKKSREKVQALGFFKDVNFATPRGTRDDTLDLDITVEERPTGSFSVGAGFSTTEDFVFTGSLSKQNFFGLGINGEVSAEVSSRRQQFLFSMVDPYFLDTEWILGVSSFRTVFRFEDFDRDSYGGSFSIGHRFFDYASMSLGYQAEQVTAEDFSALVPQRFRTNASGLTSLVSLTLNRDTRDDRLYANKGMFNSVKGEVSGDKLGGDNDFFRITGKTQLYQPLGKGFSFRIFLRAGYIHSLNNDIIPLYDRFFLGGVNSMRGFFPQSIGAKENVTDANGNPASFVFGGNKMFVSNFEIEYPIYAPVGLKFVTFFDAGNAYSEQETLAFNQMRMNYGFGIRWVSPMGPLRFEWGFPIDRQPDEQKSVFNFTIGQFF